MNYYETYYMLLAAQELLPERTFFRDRYFPTNVSMDVFGTAKVLVDYREGEQKLAPFVVPRIGGIAVMRKGFETFELEPPNISLSMPLTLDQLQQRGFGEALNSQMTPEDRARLYQLGDLEELSRRISRREEWMAAQTILNNGCTMRHITERAEIYEDVEVRYYKGVNNPTIYTPANPWVHGSNAWRKDVAVMAKMLTKRGMPVTDLVVSSDVADFIMEDDVVQKMLDNKRMEMGRIEPKLLPNGVVHIGALNFGGVILDILSVDETYENEAGTTTPYLDSGSVIVTAPNCGHTLYGAVSQLEDDGQFYTYAAPRVPQHIFTKKPPVKETQMTAKPLMAPNRKGPWSVAKKVFD